MKLPQPCSFLVTFKLTDSDILLLGGSVMEGKHTRTTDEVYKYDVVQGVFRQVESLNKPVLSLYPPFYEAGSLFIVDEDA